MRRPVALLLTDFVVACLVARVEWIAQSMSATALLDFDESSTSVASPSPRIVIPRHSSLTYLHYKRPTEQATIAPLHTLRTDDTTPSDRRHPLIAEVVSSAHKDRMGPHTTAVSHSEQRNHSQQQEQQQPLHAAHQLRRAEDGMPGTARPEWVDAMLSAIVALDARLARIESSVAAIESARRTEFAQQHASCT